MFRYPVWFGPTLPKLLGVHTVSRALLAGDERAVRVALTACAAASPDLIRLAGLDDGGMLVTDRLLLPETPTEWQFRAIEPQVRMVLDFDCDQVIVLADFLRDAGNASVPDMVDAWPVSDVDLAPYITDLAPPATSSRSPGIYRREHASLLIRSHTTGVLLDPIGLSSLPSVVPHAPRPLTDELDAILITHSHGDHWHVPSLLVAASRADLPVIVPIVPRPNLLCDIDFARDCALLGQTVHPLAWHDHIEIGDIVVEALPFYGEQPTRDAPGPAPALRSWGNCYRITTRDFSCIVLADAGTDSLGSIDEACRTSCERHGPVDVVLSCQREFAAPFFTGLLDWPALPYARLQELQRQAVAGTLRSSTGGVTGAVDACIAAGARYFLPYANGFERLGTPIRDIGWGDGEPSEADCNARMMTAFARRAAKTQVVPWNPGDLAVVRDGTLVICPFAND